MSKITSTGKLRCAGTKWLYLLWRLWGSRNGFKRTRSMMHCRVSNAALTVSLDLADVSSGHCIIIWCIQYKSEWRPFWLTRSTLDILLLCVCTMFTTLFLLAVSYSISHLFRIVRTMRVDFRETKWKLISMQMDCCLWIILAENSVKNFSCEYSIYLDRWILAVKIRNKRSFVVSFCSSWGSVSVGNDELRQLIKKT